MIETKRTRGTYYVSPLVMYKLLTVLVLVGLIGNGLAEVNLCSNVVDNLFLPHVTNCSEYYLCIGKYIPSKRMIDIKIGSLIDVLLLHNPSQSEHCT